MNKLSREKQIQIINCLVEGNSIRATCRMTGAAKGTVLRLLVDVGTKAGQYQHDHLRELTSKRIECDEIWSFCHSKEANVPKEKKGELGYGDVWTWTAIDSDTKLVMSFFIGNRDVECAEIFIKDLASRLLHRIQLSTDGHRAYLQAVDSAFNYDEIDYGMLIKLYGRDVHDPSGRKYSPAKCIGTVKEVKRGSPREKFISTSYAERQNLTMRMSMRRFTRLTNAFSKKVENLYCAVALHFMYYNYCRVHSSLGLHYKMTPAMASCIENHIWTVEEMLHVLLDSN